MSLPRNTDPPGRNDYTTMPRWVKWTLIAIVALILLAIVTALVVGGDHGPGRHFSAPAPAPDLSAGADVVLTGQ